MRNEKEYRELKHFDDQKTFAASNSFARLASTNVLRTDRELCKGLRAQEKF